MNRDFYSSANRDLLPSENRDRTTGRLIKYYPSIYLQNGVWGAYDYCLSVKPSDFDVRDVRYSRIRITQTSLGTTGIWDVLYSDGLSNPILATIQSGSPVFNGPVTGSFLVEDFKSPTVSSGFRAGGGAGLTWKKELLDPENGFASNLIADTYEVFSTLTEFRSYEPDVGIIFILDTACWSKGVIGWKRVENNYGSSEMLANQLLSVHATDTSLKYDGMDQGSEAVYLSFPPTIIPTGKQGLKGATASCIVQSPIIIATSGERVIAGTTVATPAYLWNVRLSKVLVRVSRANYLEYYSDVNDVTVSNTSQILCETDRVITDGILQPVSADKIQFFTSRYYGSVCFPPFATSTSSWVEIPGIPSCFNPA